MKKIIYSTALLSLAIFGSCGDSKESSKEKKAYADEDIKIETKKANAFFDV